MVRLRIVRACADQDIRWQDVGTVVATVPIVGDCYHAPLEIEAAIDALGTAGLPFESAGEDAEDDDATTWNIDYLYDVGLMIGGGSNNIQKNIISERGLDLPREPKVARA